MIPNTEFVAIQLPCLELHQAKKKGRLDIWNCLFQSWWMSWNVIRSGSLSWHISRNRCREGIRSPNTGGDDTKFGKVSPHLGPLLGGGHTCTAGLTYEITLL
ncbi:Ceramide Transfer Protein [Manis pentadactyla]|nr:Ceramide Transfer Protein [Manis pentadactyla]